MRLKGLLDRLLDIVAPHACPMCDEGSGLRRDATTGELARCPFCQGTGLSRNHTRRNPEAEADGTGLPGADRPGTP
jgi:hypothetical protein